MNIKDIPIKELQKDKQESLNDIKVCKEALTLGVTTYSGGSTQVRLDTNIKIVEKIDKELKIRTGGEICQK